MKLLLKDFIRANGVFEFKAACSPDSPDELVFSQAEAENEQALRSLADLARSRFPQLKYKISKSIRSAFKEKFREFLQEAVKSRPLASNHSPSGRSVTFKDFKTKNSAKRSGEDFSSESPK
jgi:hypothetical protein